ncbi:MAG: DNA-directed RNA polymerase sigma subunit (sigma70/sigma32) [Myxococcota bacterium]
MKNKRTTTVTTRVNVREALERANTAALTDVEEKVLRMRHGAAARPDAPLGLKGQQFAETRAKLAMIEELVLEQMRRPAPKPAAAAPEADSTKDHIIRRLRGDK